MNLEVSYLAAFLVGLFGGVHCVGMCGGIVGALGFGLPEPVRSNPMRLLPYLLAYNGGRLLSYTVAGVLVGGVGWLAANMVAMHQVKLVMQVVAGLFMIALGLYLGGWWFGLTRIERIGGKAWRYLEPLGRKLMPVRTPVQAMTLGLVWGWLPCGLVYSVLIWVVSAGDPVKGGALMLSFGLGTLPNLLAMGFVAGQLGKAMRLAWVKHLAGGLVVLFGLYTLVQGLMV